MDIAALFKILLSHAGGLLQERRGAKEVACPQLAFTFKTSFACVIFLVDGFSCSARLNSNWAVSCKHERTPANGHYTHSIFMQVLIWHLLLKEGFALACKMCLSSLFGGKGIENGVSRRVTVFVTDSKPFSSQGLRRNETVPRVKKLGYGLDFCVFRYEGYKQTNGS